MVLMEARMLAHVNGGLFHSQVKVFGMPRATWKGFIKLSLVSVPVKGYTATSSSESVSLNQLHAECHSRIQYKKSCPIHGEVSNDEIVKGYEFAKDQYAIIDTDEIEKLRSESDRSINIQKFISPELLDPIYFSGKTYYLTPDGQPGQKPYALLHQALVEENLCGLAQVVISNREQLVALRPLEKLLTISVLHYAAELNKPAAYEDELGSAEVSDQELKLAKTLIEATTEDEVSLDNYRDLYNERLTKLIETKVAGQEIVQAPAEEGPAVINLMDALKASVERTRGKAPTAKAAARKAPEKKMPVAARKRAPTKKAKTG
jgi:DNA end-binding protein Ku